MTGVHALVAEDTAHLVHLVKAAHNEPLQVQLGLNTQVHGNIQRIVVGDEGAGVGADLDGLQNGSVHFQKSAGVEELAQRLQNLAALDEGILDLRVDDGVHVALTVADILILQAVPLFRKHPQGLGQQRQLVSMNGDLAGFGTEDYALHADDIADVHGFEVRVYVLAHVLAAHIGLNLAVAVQHVDERSLTHDAAAHHPARDADGLALQRVKIRQNLRGGVGAVKTGDGIGIAAFFLILGQLGAANLLLFAQVLNLLNFRGHEAASFVDRMNGAQRLISSTFSCMVPPGTSTSTT